MKLRLPSPAMVVSILALVVSLSGSAIAAKYLITSSKQVKTGSINSGDIANGSIKGGDIASGALTARELRADLRTSVERRESTSATEVVRAQGPTATAENGGSQVVATLKSLAPGSYLIMAKTALSSASEQQKGLLDAVLNSETHLGKCTLDAAGTSDEQSGTIISPASKSPAPLSMQLTRTIASPINVVLRCESDTAWRAGGSSIVAIAVGSSTRQSVDG